MTRDPNKPRKFSKTIMGNGPVVPNSPPSVPLEDQETILSDSSADTSGDSDIKISGDDDNWVISFNTDGTQTASKVTNVSVSGISDSQLGRKVIEGAKQKFGSDSKHSTASGFPKSADSFEPGAMVYKYEIIKLLGRGGMGSVYVAHDTKLARKVAIKFLSAKISKKKKFKKRFMIEAQATAKLNHENIVTIYDVGEYQNSPYLVLEYLEGLPLTKLIKNRKLPMQQALQYSIPIARGLDAAHTKGIIHRDLKPDNIFILKDGGVKILDFGLARMVETSSEEIASKEDMAREIKKDKGGGLTKAGAIMGTYAYMSPEQWGLDKVDHQSDIWAFGVILFEMLTGEHPAGTRSAQVLADLAAKLDEPMRTIRDVDPALPQNLSEVVAKCLQKRKVNRYQSIAEVVRDLEDINPSNQSSRRISTTESPYPGLATFQERDANKFFGRDAEIARFINKMKTNALLAVIGQSGAGKSSFIRAGVIPTIKSQGRKPWDMIVVRPGRDPFAGIASALLKTGRTTSTSSHVKEERRLAEKLKKEPGQLGTLLRARARASGHPVMFFVDQFEEIFTIVTPEDAKLFATSLAGAAEEPESPVRVVLAMRSDFLDRVAEYPDLMEKVTKDVTILQSPGPQGLRDAIIKPAEMMGYTFEDPNMIEEMITSLKNETAALPLLQFTASKLWENRDKTRKLLTRKVYEEMGGVGGALANHADAVLTSLTTTDRNLVKKLFLRLVTSDGTRAVIMASEISSLMGTAAAKRILGILENAHLITISRTGEHGENAQIEIIHESLIVRWKTLRRWLEEDNENAAMLQQLRDASKQWDMRGRPTGLLWSGDALEEARLWLKKYQGGLTALEKLFLDTAFKIANRSARMKKMFIAGLIIVMALITLGAIGALFAIRGAEKKAKQQAIIAKQQAKKAEEAKQEVKKKMVLLAKETEKAKKAETLASNRLKEVVKARAKEQKSQKDLKEANKALKFALENAKLAQKRAEEATIAARKAAIKVRRSAESEKKARLAAERAKKRLKVLLDRERRTVQRLKALRSKIIQKLPSR